MIQSKTFENGLKLIVKPMQGLFSVTMGILVGTGSAFETDEEDGISHFIEHVQFKGTPTRSAEKISDDFDAIGAQVNAFTGKDLTCYYAKSTGEHAFEAFAILSDLFLNATFPKDELDRERGVILEEISMNEDTPEDLCLDVLSHAFYGNGTYGRTILGPEKNVKRFEKEDIFAYKRKHYVPENIVISMAGDISFDAACKMTEKFFSALPRTSYRKQDKIIQRHHRSVIKTKPIEQTHLALTFPCYPRMDKKGETMQLINLVLGGGMSSRLYLQLRERSGLAYTVYSYLSAYEECGNFSVYAGVNDKNAERAYESILKEIRLFKQKGITTEEFKKGKEQMKSSIVFAQESTASQMLLYGKHFLYHGEVFSFEEKTKAINAITMDDVHSCIEENFEEDKMCVACVGKRKDALKL